MVQLTRYCRFVGSWPRTIRAGLLVAVLLAVSTPAALAQLVPVKTTADELKEKFSSIEKEVARLRAAGDATAADEMAGKLKAFQARAQGAAAPASDTAELHVVGALSGVAPAAAQPAPAVVPQPAVPQPPVAQPRPPVQGDITVELNVTDRPLILALCAQNPVKWRVKPAAGVKLKKVILGGLYPQQLEGVADDVPVERYIQREDASKPYFYAYRRTPDDANYARTARTLFDVTGLQISTFQGSVRPATPFVVGPPNEEWAAQRLLAEVQPLYESAIAFERAEARKAVQGIRFTALRFVRREAGNRWGASTADFTPAGPITPTLKELPGDCIAMAADPKTGTRYVIQSNELYSIARGGTELDRIDPPDSPARMSWPTTLAFDGKRRRLVVGDRGTIGRLAYYQVDRKTWSTFEGAERMYLHALCYSPYEDRLYAFGVSLEARRDAVLIRYTGDGQEDGRTVIPGVKFTSVFPQPMMPSFQLIPAGRLLVLLSAPANNVSDPRLPPSVTSYVVDPLSGRVLFTGPSEPQPAAPPAIPARELGPLWDAALGEKDDAQADLAIWTMVAVGEPAVPFLAERLPPVVLPESEQVRQAVARLGDADWRVRDEALVDLHRMGSSIEGELRRMLAGKIEDESRLRLEVLLDQFRWEASSGRRPTADLNVRRDVRAVAVLSRVGTPAAIEKLREYAAGPVGAARTEEAKVALARLFPEEKQ